MEGNLKMSLLLTVIIAALFTAIIMKPLFCAMVFPTDFVEPDEVELDWARY